MQSATIWLKLSKDGSNVQLEGITPAEAVVLTSNVKGHMSHFVNAGGFPLHDIDEKSIREAKELVMDEEQVMREFIYKDDPKEKNTDNTLKRVQVLNSKARTDAQEMMRLKRKYKGALVEALFPGAAPTLPSSFDVGMPWRTDDKKKIEESLVVKKVEEKKPEEPKKEEPKK